ncbi:hypothetical protein DSO57_1013260 [Entomophthora muscae]|uniref:Uncharacterized protein n=1 Tax=Entomophthora muscae TaxID=34485 RepID=A0ACC2T5N3_9FUNG|nr:hypothetical protein DSO57_1013260 [Entomophthora muscae]
MVLLPKANTEEKPLRPGVVPKPGGGFILSSKEKARQVAQGLCMYCGLAGHMVMNCPTARPNPFKPPSNPNH